MLEKLEKERKEIYNEILGVYKELNKYLDYCLKRTTCNFTPIDNIARKKVNRLEQLANRLHVINDKLELMGAL